ncbi:PilZ domain-containing protein [Companilactobacillus farciminis]|uniref:PilZ domain-containing protein n=1 Tax=Companilactobacillus farciminis TaxID=1612 RepID=UPI001F1A1DB4|nr:PilZ domain-containing protein [Companilactobacillus farciminis]
MGRPVYRKSERFIRKIHGIVTFKDGTTHPITTEDVSEGGIAFTITDDTKEGLDEEDDVKLSLKHQDFNIRLTGKIARISKRDKTKIYSAQVKVPNDENEDHYLQVIYDGINKTLPSVQDTWVTPFDELYMNLVVRAKTIERKISSRFNRF